MGDIKSEGRQARDSLGVSDLSDQKFGPQPSKERRMVLAAENNIQIFRTCSGNYDRPYYLFKV